DLDDDLTTINDQELYAATFDGSAWGPLTRLTDDAVVDANPQLGFNPAGDFLLAWMRDGALVTATNLAVATPTTVATPAYSNSTADFRMATATDGRLALIWADASLGGSDLFAAFYDPIFGNWGAAKQLTFDDDTERDLTVDFLDAGSLMGVYNKVAIQVQTQQHTTLSGATVALAVPTPGTTDLAVFQYTTGSDVAAVAGSLTSDPVNPLPGTVATTTLSVINLGETTLQDIDVALYDGDPSMGGTELGRATVPGPLVGGATAAISIPWTVPSVVVPMDLYAVVDPDGLVADRDRLNNVLTTPLVLPDLAVTNADWSNPGGHRRTLVATVTNTGAVSSLPTVVTFRQGSATGPILGEVGLPAMAPYDATDLPLNWDITGLTGDTVQVHVMVDEAQATADLNRGNNSRSMEVVISGDDDGDGVTNLVDNCDGVPNADQLDTDTDGVGNPCDNCGTVANADQLDTDGDLAGNACDPDDDNDGLTDDFETTATGTDPLLADTDGNGTLDGAEDPDVDGLTNTQEQTLGTGPLDGTTAPFALTGLTVNAASAALTWPSVAGRDFTVWASDEPYGDTMTWTDLGPIPAGAGTTTFTDDGSLTGATPGAVTQRWYKVTIGGITTPTCGFLRLTLGANSQTLASLPVVPFSESVNDLFGHQLDGGFTSSEADQLLLLDPTTQSYERHWLFDSGGAYPA
ncbi:MAG: hypothetical protein CO109_14800, partial [Deltaproteobacteria bacterium CG_4_9_14_3_um_filter_65_9]